MTIGELIEQLKELAVLKKADEPEVSGLATLAITAIELQLGDIQKLFDIFMAADSFVLNILKDNELDADNIHIEQTWEHKTETTKALAELTQKIANMCFEMKYREEKIRRVQGMLSVH